MQGNPADDSEPTTHLPAWANTGLIDLEAAGGRRVPNYIDRRTCEPCAHSWNGDPVCMFCGNDVDHTWAGRVMQPGSDSHRWGVSAGVRR